MKAWKLALAFGLGVASVLVISRGIPAQASASLEDVSGGTLSQVDEAQVHQRAQALFDFDRKNPQKLPGGLLRQLSVAIRFGNVDGAAKIVNYLEPQMR